MKALILINSALDLGIESEGEFFTSIRVYNNDSDALMAFAETPCTWSEVVDYVSEEQVKAKAAEILQNLKDGKYDDYM